MKDEQSNQDGKHEMETVDTYGNDIKVDVGKWLKSGRTRDCECQTEAEYFIGYFYYSAAINAREGSEFVTFTPDNMATLKRLLYEYKLCKDRRVSNKEVENEKRLDKILTDATVTDGC